MNDECLICGAPLVYLEQDEMMECAICHKKELSKTRCVNGHYVCDECHTKGMDVLLDFCQKSDSKDPAAILEGMMDLSFCHMHGPEHHVMVGMALLTAYHNAGGKLPNGLYFGLMDMMRRGRQVPGGVCGFWGACGAGISAGMFLSIISGGSPLATEGYKLSHLMTARCLARIGEVGGPRCCKRNSFIAVEEAVRMVKETFGVEMELHPITCRFVAKNNQCIGLRCPLFPKRDS